MTVPKLDQEAADLDDILEAIQPAGFKVLVGILPRDQQMKSGLWMPEDRRDLEQIASLWGKVLAKGPLAYVDSERFPSGPWCEIGDTIMMRAYSGTRFRLLKHPDYEFRLINDDTVEAVIRGDPREVERA